MSLSELVAGSVPLEKDAKSAPAPVRTIDAEHFDPTSVQSLSDEDFSSAVSAIVSAFGDPTRREIYLYAREVDGVNASEVASRFDLHPNVARHHLDKLASGGYLDVAVDRTALAGAGRPSKRYRVSVKNVNLDTGNRTSELTSMLLGRALELIPRDLAEKMAEEVGETYGKMLATQMQPAESQRSLASAMRSVAEALTAHGFSARAQSFDESIGLVAAHCPFGTTAQTHPVLCAVDRGMVRGMLGALCGTTIPVTISSRARGDNSCSAIV
ncbi:MAG: helix-turn-helix domain-containing protein [Acidimicrobiaceae bacterium]|nr:helix-turn-helix domain-containing protein [Acidimicrobiaceae bacterium]